MTISRCGTVELCLQVIQAKGDDVENGKDVVDVVIDNVVETI